MKEKAEISIIVPCHNEQDSLPVFYCETEKVLQTITDDYELVFVDDGSTDATLDKLRHLSREDQHVKYISFSRNFGKEAAMYAGLCRALGDYIVIMDADMQDPPSLLPEMYQILRNGEYDCVATRRTSRKGEPVVRSWFARMFYHIINKISDADIKDGARDFRMMHRKMADAIISMGEYNRFSKGIFGWVGFRTYWIAYENIPRVAGNSNWSFWGLFKYALDGIINFSQAPLSVASWTGIVMTGISFLLMLFIVIRRLIFGDPVAGWASTVCIIIFIGGIQLFCMGIIGQYIAKIYLETKHRPQYIIAEDNLEASRKKMQTGQKKTEKQWDGDLKS